ncbi:hypothetical protein [Streptomyces sp. NPDC057199]|uniref:hypothetical protein n=1 Tax=Streptomyces sp. NPDC057199 TaxID=3346047 RepID=UPI00362D6245
MSNVVCLTASAALAVEMTGGLLADRFGSQRILLWAMVIWSLQGIFPAAMKAVAERTGR